MELLELLLLDELDYWEEWKSVELELLDFWNSLRCDFW